MTKIATFNELEHLSLNESNREIAAIGRNINQIVKACNAMLQFTIEKKLLDELMDKINANHAATRVLLRANQAYWGIDD